MHIENPVEVWTRLIPDPYEPGALRPDLPSHVGFAANGGIVRDLLAEGAPVATGYVSVFIETKHADAKACPQLVPADDVPARGKLLVAMIRAGHDGREAFLNALDMAGADDTRKRDVAFTLEQARARGMPAAKVLQIAERLGVADMDVAEIRGEVGK